MFTKLIYNSEEKRLRAGCRILIARTAAPDRRRIGTEDGVTGFIGLIVMIIFTHIYVILRKRMF